MCVVVKVNGVECETKAELRNALGVEPITREGYQRFEDGDCLCPCNLGATAKLANMTLAGDQWDEQTMTSNVIYTT